MNSGTFKYGTQTVKMQLGYHLAHTKLLDLGLDILSVLAEKNTVIQTIMFDDSVMLKIWFFYVEAALPGTEWEEALKTLDSTPGGLQQFKDAFWALTVNFFSPSMRPAIQSMWNQIKKQVENVDAAILNTSSSASLVEQDSPQV